MNNNYEEEIKRLKEENDNLKSEIIKIKYAVYIFKESILNNRQIKQRQTKKSLSLSIEI